VTGVDEDFLRGEVEREKSERGEMVDRVGGC
jgi:hypothetical protein